MFSDVAEWLMGKESMAKIDLVGELDEEKERIAVSFSVSMVFCYSVNQLGFSVVATYRCLRILVYDRQLRLVSIFL